MTNGVKVSAEVMYNIQYSNPIHCDFVFNYKITIENFNHHPIQLLRRKWYIKDMCFVRVVEGEGVIGQQPIIAPKEQYQYVSFCNLSAEIGHMYGCYVMKIINNPATFEVHIPLFKMVAPFKLN